MKEKIIELMKNEGLTSSRLAEILGIQPSGISHIVSGRNKPGFDLLQKILRRFPRINPDWLLLDSPTIYRPESDAMGATTAGDSTLSPHINLFGSSLLEAGDEPQNIEGNSALNEVVNLAQNSAQNRLNSEGEKVDVESVIILYSDGTFRTYKMR